jgi:hypothetical protein
MSIEDCFPYKPLEDVDKHGIAELCGGPPVTSLDQVKIFFQYLAKPMINNMQIKQLLVVASESCAQSFDIRPSRGREIYQRGALLYAGVLAELSPLPEVPCEPNVFAGIARSEDYDFSWESSERLKNEVPSFCSFAEELAPALETTHQPESHLVIAGAALMHVITTDSLRLIGECRQLELDHPELADLEDIFLGIENQ